MESVKPFKFNPAYANIENGQLGWKVGRNTLKLDSDGIVYEDEIEDITEDELKQLNEFVEKTKTKSEIDEIEDITEDNLRQLNSFTTRTEAEERENNYISAFKALREGDIDGFIFNDYVLKDIKQYIYPVLKRCSKGRRLPALIDLWRKLWEPNVKIEAIGLNGKTTCVSCGLTRKISYVVEEDDEPLAYIGVNCYDDRISSLYDFVVKMYGISSGFFLIESPGIVKFDPEFVNEMGRGFENVMEIIDETYREMYNQRMMLEFLERRKRR